MKTTETEIRAKVDKRSAEKAEKIFAKLGLTTNDAIKLFLHEVELQRAMPFPV